MEPTLAVLRFAPALPLRGTSLQEDGLGEAKDCAHQTTTPRPNRQSRQHDLDNNHSDWTCIIKSSELHLNNQSDLSKVRDHFTYEEIQQGESGNDEAAPHRATS